MKIKRVLQVGAALAIWTALCVVLYLFVRNSSREELIGWAILMIFLFGLGILSARFKSVERLVSSAFAAYMKITFWLFVSILPAYPFYWLHKISADVPLRLQVLIFLLWGVMLAWALWLLVLEKNRIRVFDWLRQRVGAFAPLAYSYNLIWVAVFFFSSVTYLLVNSGSLAWVAPADREITPSAISNFYFWHFLNAIPVFKITDTLLWKEPLTYDNGWVGLLLLLFKVIVISPIIGAFISYWRLLGKEKTEENPVRKPRKTTARTYRPRRRPLR